ncbi:MAG: MogA/MoaB family molybdenum cofactor biosynthesis protein [Coriobacteriia bacterium]|nr:MogA/MoaB family molybdenum cofactor biosynthesis protein [Coriobacteriia bacterium]MBN2822006.1 MogA/MoaB family molybdenum cofactor biosynthesis protein [Coriobacteriia bacterium]
MTVLRIGVLTSSDTRAAGKAEDTSGKAIIAISEARGWIVSAYHVVPDDQEAIARAIIEMCDVDEVDVLLSTGGTGLGPRDICPETTLAHADREVPGIAEAIRAESMRVTSRAMLSRGVAAQRGRTLIINLPGSEKAVRESLGFVIDQLEHAVEMIAGGGHG